MFATTCRLVLALLLGLALAKTQTMESEKIGSARSVSTATWPPARTRSHHDKSHHHHHHHHHHRKHHHKHKHHKSNASPVPVKHETATVVAKQPASKGIEKASAGGHSVADAKVVSRETAAAKEKHIVASMKALEAKLAKKRSTKQGSILVNGPLPGDFGERFAQAVALATGTERAGVKVDGTKPGEQNGVVQVTFSASPRVVEDVEQEASDPDSKLAGGNLHSFLVARDDDKEEPEKPQVEAAAEPVEKSGIDIDTAMPYGDLEPFGREDTAQELTESSVQESNAMVDQLERAEVAEEKRAVFRALTRLRGAAITSFDGVARSQTGNIDEYNKIHQWRKTHPLHHLADEESDVSKWAFPDNADF